MNIKDNIKLTSTQCSIRDINLIDDWEYEID